MKYKSAEQLNIKAAVRDALLVIMTRLKVGDITKKMFDMGSVMDTRCQLNNGGECGTVGCIGGYVGLEMFDGDRTKAYEYVTGLSHRNVLYKLYYPGSDAAYKSGPEVAARVIERFLQTNVIDWEKELGQ